ncbi:MAG: hypothetical protein NT062_21780 [Proteobacteria bacterium]|nr:hypothetical protein [Pseudomonadota bacterium]
MSADFLGRIVVALDAAEVPHMVVGSFASTFHGVPRAKTRGDALDTQYIERWVGALEVEAQWERVRA